MAENTQYQKVKEITNQLEQGIQDLFQSEKYMDWLKTMSKFHDYSLNNTLLICFQKPEATLVAGYNSWRKNFGRQVKKGEKAIKILAPAPYKKMVEMEKIDPNTQKPMLDADGNPIKETKEIKQPAFKVVNVFDVSQTDGKEIPSLGVDELTGNVAQYEQFFEALKRTCPVPIEFEEIAGGAKGYYHQMEQRIAIQKDMSQVQTIKTAIHEMAHQKLHAIDPNNKDVEKSDLTRNSKEVEAESVAYTICQHYGIDTSDYSFAYVAGWSHGKEVPELKASLNTIRKSANEMITEIDGHMLDIKRERATELANELYAYADEVDPYGSQDSIEYVEEFIRDTSKDLLDAGEKAEGILKWLKETPVATEELETRGKELIEKVSTFTGITLDPEATISFYVAECMEFTNLGEYHENLTLSEAMKLYEQIPADRMNGIKGIGFELHDGSMYEGQYPLMEAGKIDEDLINMVEHYKNSPLVQQAIADCKEMLENKERFEFAKDLYEKGFVYDGYTITSVAAYDLRQDGLEPLLFSDEQLNVIKKGLNEGLDISAINNPDLSVDEMKKGLREIRKEHSEYIKSISSEKFGANALENGKGKKKSVLADLHEKQEKVSGTNAPKKSRTKKQTKEIE